MSALMLISYAHSVVVGTVLIHWCPVGVACRGRVGGGGGCGVCVRYMGLVSSPLSGPYQWVLFLWSRFRVLVCVRLCVCLPVWRCIVVFGCWVGSPADWLVCVVCCRSVWFSSVVCAVVGVCGVGVCVQNCALLWCGLQHCALVCCVGYIGHWCVRCCVFGFSIVCCWLRWRAVGVAVVVAGGGGGVVVVGVVVVVCVVVVVVVVVLLVLVVLVCGVW